MNLNEQQLKKRNLILKLIGIILTAIPPILLACVFIGPIDSNLGSVLIHVLWCGFYGSILLWWSQEAKVFKWVMPILNVFPFLFVALGTMMGGIGGLFIVILKMLIPYVPWISLLG